MSAITPERLAELREVAESTLGGSWGTRGVLHGDDGLVAYIRSSETGPVAKTYGFGPVGDNAAHIAEFDPPTALALLDEVERLRAVVERVREFEQAVRDCYEEDSNDSVSVGFVADTLRLSLTIGDDE